MFDVRGSMFDVVDYDAQSASVEIVLVPTWK